MLVATMESSQRKKGMSKIICVIWEIKRLSPFVEDAPIIYRKWVVKMALNEVM